MLQARDQVRPAAPRGEPWWSLGRPTAAGGCGSTNPRSRWQAWASTRATAALPTYWRALLFCALMHLHHHLCVPPAPPTRRTSTWATCTGSVPSLGAPSRGAVAARRGGQGTYPRRARTCAWHALPGPGPRAGACCRLWPDRALLRTQPTNRLKLVRFQTDCDSIFRLECSPPQLRQCAGHRRLPLALSAQQGGGAGAGCKGGAGLRGGCCLGGVRCGLNSRGGQLHKRSLQARPASSLSILAPAVTRPRAWRPTADVHGGQGPGGLQPEAGAQAVWCAGGLAWHA